MKNNQLLPFERNRYYVGKLLTSSDFQVEQTYGNQKRRFLNELMFGSGIVCGLGVYSLDDVSIMVESGVALDAWGREIVLENTVMKKLSAIEGFETLQTTEVVLCLRYEENDVHPVYAVSAGTTGDNYECNRIQEGYALCLRDRAELPTVSAPLSNFLATATLYADDFFSVSLSLPASVGCGQTARLLLRVTQTAETTQALTLTIPLQVPAFLSSAGDHTCPISLMDVLPGVGQTVEREYWLTAQSSPTNDSVLMADADSIRIVIGGEPVPSIPAFLLKVTVEDLRNDDLIARAIGSVSLEERALESQTELIPLAQFALQRTKSAYLIEDVTEDGIKHYLQTNAAAPLRTTYRSWLPAATPVAGLAQPESTDVPLLDSTPAYREPLYATGLCEIPLPADLRPNHVVYSDEILHGLGKGIVYVRAGLEYFDEDPKLGAAARNTIYGDPLLFQEEQPPVPAAELAVKVMNDRGSFVVAVRVEEPAPMAVLTLRWNAFALPSHEEGSKLQRLSGKSISAVQPTVVMATREIHYFSVNFKNMEPCTLTYELTEADSGHISADGIYTAPGKEGVYEIRISCADMPLISTYAYAVVKKRNAEDKDETER